MASSRTVAVIAADFDGDSSRPGSSGNNFYWKKHSGLLIANEISREWGHYTAAAVELAAQSAYADGRTPLLLGGGHSLTYWMVRAAVRRFGRLNLMVFDAHHDRYRQKRLSHYTVMTRIQRDLPVALVPFGNRFEMDGAVPIEHDTFPGAPWYVSVDVDYFTPQILASVMHSVESPGETFDVGRIRESLATIPAGSPIIGADIVEWIHARSNEAEATVIDDLLGVITRLLETQRCD